MRHNCYICGHLLLQLDSDTFVHGVLQQPTSAERTTFVGGILRLLRTEVDLAIFAAL